MEFIVVAKGGGSHLECGELGYIGTFHTRWCDVAGVEAALEHHGFAIGWYMKSHGGALCGVVWKGLPTVVRVRRVVVVPCPHIVHCCPLMR